MKCGVGDYTYNLSTELNRHGVEVYVITSRDLRISRKGVVDIRPVIKRWDFSGLIPLLEKIKETTPAIVHLQYPTQAYRNKIMINIFPFIFRMFFRIPLIVTIHDARTSHLLNKVRLVTFLFCAKNIIITSEEEKRYLAVRFPFFRDKLRLIYIGANIKNIHIGMEERKNIRKRLGVKGGEILIAHFGYILKKKRLEVIFYVLRQLLDDGYRIKLIMISDFNPDRDRYHASLKELVRRLNLARDVIWTGYSKPEDVSMYLASSDICIEIYPDGVSFRRGSFLAALSHGLPVVTTKGDILPKGLIEYHNILAVRGGDVDRLADSVKELISNPQMRERIGRNAKEFSRRFSWEDIARSHIELYNEVQKNTLN